MKCIVCRKAPVLAPQDTCYECRKALHRAERCEALAWDIERAKDKHERWMGRG